MQSKTNHKQIMNRHVTNIYTNLCRMHEDLAPSIASLHITVRSHVNSILIDANSKPSLNHKPNSTAYESSYYQTLLITCTL